MPRTSVTRRVPHPWEEVYSLALNVESYPRFVPFCHVTNVLGRSDHNGDNEIIVRMDIGSIAFQERFTSRILGRRANREIRISNIDGPLRHLDGRWLFTPAGNCITDVELEIDCKFHSHFMSAVASMVFTSLSGDLVAAFEKRAAQMLA